MSVLFNAEHLILLASLETDSAQVYAVCVFVTLCCLEMGTVSMVVRGPSLCTLGLVKENRDRYPEESTRTSVLLKA